MYYVLYILYYIYIYIYIIYIYIYIYIYILQECIFTNLGLVSNLDDFLRKFSMKKFV